MHKGKYMEFMYYWAPSKYGGEEIQRCRVYPPEMASTHKYAVRHHHIIKKLIEDPLRKDYRACTDKERGLFEEYSTEWSRKLQKERDELDAYLQDVDK